MRTQHFAYPIVCFKIHFCTILCLVISSILHTTLKTRTVVNELTFASLREFSNKTISIQVPCCTEIYRCSIAHKTATLVVATMNAAMPRLKSVRLWFKTPNTISTLLQFLSSFVAKLRPIVLTKYFNSYYSR